MTAAAFVPPAPTAPTAAPGSSGLPGLPNSPGASADALLRHLEWTVVRRLDGLLQGDYRTLWRGAGLDLADLREYQHFDDVRHIDWNVTARLQQPYVRQFTEDRELTAWLLIDLSASVDFGSAALTKRALARHFVGVLARLLTRHGNRVGALLYGTEVDTVLPPGNSRAHVLNLLQRMAARPPHKVSSASGGSSASSPGSAAGMTQLRDLLVAAQRIVKRRSAVFVISDFISTPGWGDALAQLATRHDVTAVRVFDRLEMALPDFGLLTMRDAESGEQLVVDTHDRGFRERFAAAAQRRETALREALGRAGVDTMELATDGDLLDAIVRFAGLRRQRSRRGSGAGSGTGRPARSHPADLHGSASPAPPPSFTQGAQS